MSFNAIGNTTLILCPVVVPICHTTQFSDYPDSLGNPAFFQLQWYQGQVGPASLGFTDPAATSAPASVSHLILFTNMRSANFSFAPDLSSATFTSTGLPWLSGGFAYTAGGPPLTSPSACGGPDSYTSGSVKSTLSANLDVVGTKSFPPTSMGFLLHHP